MTRRLLSCFFVVALAITGPVFQARAGGGFGIGDVQEMLRSPNVRLVAVEFYADWCGPCKKSIPDWKKLHEKYQSGDFG